MNALWNLTQCCAPIKPTRSSQQKPKKRYKYVQPPRGKSCRPVETYTPPEDKLDDRTVYKMSYMSLETELQDDFTRDNYNLRFCLPPQPPNTPLCPQCSSPPQMCTQCPNTPQLCPQCSCPPQLCPLCLCMNSAPCSFHPNSPEGECWKPNYQTVQKLSYQARQVQREEKPWKKKAQYIPPKVKMDDRTVHKLSYAPPGQFVECTDDESDCADCMCRQYAPMPPCEGPNLYPTPRCCCQQGLLNGNCNVNAMYN